MTELSERNSTSRRQSHGNRFALVAVTIVFLLVGGYLAYRALKVPGEIASGLGSAFGIKFQNEYQTKITGAIHDLKNNPKLVVLTADLDTELHKSSSTYALWIYWGTTSVDVLARDNKVQFYVPLDDVGTANFSYDETHKIMTLRIRPPLLDEEFVDVQSDPGKIEMRTANGWAKLDRFSGAPLRDEARGQLREAVLQTAKQPAQFELLELKAKANAKEHIRKLLDPLTTSLKSDVRFEIEFTEK